MPQRTPWFKCYPGNFLNGVADLSPNEIAVYTIILMRMYDEDGPVGDDPARIAHRCNMRIPTCKKAIDGLCAAGKIVREGGLLVSEKAQEVIENRREARANQQRNAQSRWHKGAEKANENNESAMRPQCRTDAEPMPNRRQITEDRYKKERKKETRARDSEFDEWYSLYPHKVGRGAALKAFRGALAKASLDTLKAGLARYVETKPPDRNWCNPATWLNQERWLDAEAAVEARAPPKHWNDHGTDSGLSPSLERILLDERKQREHIENRDSGIGAPLLTASSGDDTGC